MTFAWTLAGQGRKKVPWAEGTKAARAVGMRWGKISAGFSGGSAAASVVLERPEDDKWTSMVGSAIGGVAAATSVAEIPVRSPQGNMWGGLSFTDL